MRQGWKYQTLGDVCDVINGLWTGKKEPFINVAVIRNTNFSKDCRLRLDDVAYIDVELKQFISRKLRIGDIIIEKSGGSEKQPVGRAVLFDITEGDFSFSNFTAALRIKEGIAISPAFLHKCLYGHYLKGETLKMQSKTTGLHNLDMKAYMRLPIPVLSLEEQERIVAELDLLSGILDKQRALLKELDTLAQSIFYDMFGNPVDNERGWDAYRLGDVLKTTSGGTPSKGHPEYYDGGTIPWVNSGDLHQMFIYDVPKFITQAGVNNSSAKLFPIDTVLVAMYGATVGETSILKIESTTNQAVCGIFPNIHYLPVFLYSVLKNSQSYFIERASGGAQPNISQGIIKDFRLISPSMDVQRVFAEKIEAIEHQKTMINQSIMETQKLYDYTMDKYFG